jgi:hypothetical protein
MKYKLAAAASTKQLAYIIPSQSINRLQTIYINVFFGLP